MKQGILFGIGAYALWGFFPIYWKLLPHVPALQLLGNRIAWSFLLLAAVIIVAKKWPEFRSAALSAKSLRIYAIAAVLISINWLMYVWAVNAGNIIETSLGYFMNPLLSMLMGVIFLRERLRTLQWIPVVLAAAGVIYLTFTYGRLPWIALVLAFSFGLYGLVKKLAPHGSLYGLALETGILFLPALGFLAHADFSGSGSLLRVDLKTDLLLIGAGVITIIPLLMFASAARRLPLTTLGILQYIAPVVQFLLGVLVYREPFDQDRLIGFGLVWLALLIFSAEGYFTYRSAQIANRRGSDKLAARPVRS